MMSKLQQEDMDRSVAEAVRQRDERAAEAANTPAAAAAAATATTDVGGSDNVAWGTAGQCEAKEDDDLDENL